MVSKSSVIGIDIGASDSCVAFVGKSIVDIVQNEVSKRNTASLVSFTNRERLLGDAALALIKSNAKNSCRNFKHLLGQKVDAPHVQTEEFWSTCPLAASADGNVGYDITYKGESRVFSTPQITAMFLDKLRDITEKWCQSKVVDVVIGVPSYYSDVHRQALLDAAKIANISVLRLINEHTATALAYGIYRSNDFDAEKPCTVAFCSMGHTMFSVSIVQFFKGRLTVICEASDKVGGRDMDECLMREFSAQFQKKIGCNPLNNKKALLKLEDSVKKCKMILSSNSQAGVNCECLMEDEDFSSEMTRESFEVMCKPMMGRVEAVLSKAKMMAGELSQQIDSVEIVGGASRVPWVKSMCSAAFGGKELSTTMNADESVARGCALQAAMLSPLYKVRDFKVEDCSPYAISVGWMGSAADSQANNAPDDGDTTMTGAEGEYKTATMFQANSLMNVTKMLTFFRKGPFDIKSEYADESALIPGTSKDIGSYRIELPPQEEAKKIKVRAKLTLHGTFSIEGAQLVEEEEYEETSKEKRELPPDPPTEGEAAPEAPADVPMPDAAPAEASPSPDGEASPDAEAPKEEKTEDKKAEPKKEPEKKYEWVEVKKMKKRTKKTDLTINATGTPGLPAKDVQTRMDEESAMRSETQDIIDTDEKRNDLETYIYNTRDKIASSGQWGAFVVDADRDKFNAELTKAEDWLYDAVDGTTKVQYVEKLDELKHTGDPIVWRFNEDGMRAEWITAVDVTIMNYQKAAENPGEKYGHIAPEKLQKIVASCMELRAWLDDMRVKQELLAKHEKPVLLCATMEEKNHALAKSADEILKEPKPAPPKEEKKDEEMKADTPADNAETETKDGDKPPADSPNNMDVD